MQSFWEKLGWACVATLPLPCREKRLFSVEGLALRPETAAYVRAFAPEGVYLHQKEALMRYLEGKSVCLTTGTASGKSFAFYAAAIECLAADPQARVMVVYPLKALSAEQQERWVQALRLAGLRENVGRIDGQIPPRKRPDVLKSCRVVVMTPDVVHAWLLSNLSDEICRRFLRDVKLLVVDEVHAYSGVFGSNAAFLFRRLRHLFALLGASPRFFCASATVADGRQHLQQLFGVPFELIGPDKDTSPKHEVSIVFLRPPAAADLLSETALFLSGLAEEKKRFIVFVDSRKQTEQLATILARSRTGAAGGRGEEDEAEPEIAPGFDGEHLTQYGILPYRAGYEEHDRAIIQERLSSGQLQGVVSTSALELGLDIPNLDAAVLLGVPASATSFWQRIGRIGRHKEGVVYLLHTGSYGDEMVFRSPESLLERPFAESTLYLDNPRIQYIHALCLARTGGEHDQVAGTSDDASFDSPIDWPDGFLELCRSERIGALPAELRQMKAEAGDDPNHVFPLRDAESQFKVELRQGPEQRELGTLSFSQVMREAYPGAVYYYTTQAFRVYKVNIPSKTIWVRKEKHYTTKPYEFGTQVFPNFSREGKVDACRYGDLLIVECELQIREWITSFEERRGANKMRYEYPLYAPEAGIHFLHPYFTRNYFSTGVVMAHPAMKQYSRSVLDKAARLMYESFLYSVPLERQDVGLATDKFRFADEPHIRKDEPFVVFYDQVYGSLRLSAKIAESRVIEKLFSQAIEMAKADQDADAEAVREVTALLECLDRCVRENGRIDGPISREEVSGVEEHGDRVRVVMPGTVGIALVKNREFMVESVFFSPNQGLTYKGRYLDQEIHDTTVVYLRADLVKPVQGASKIGWYDLNTGEVIEDE